VLDYLGRLLLRKSDRIVVLGECMRERVIGKIGQSAASRVDVIHNWADGSLIKPLDADENPFKKAEKLEGKFVLLFSGNLGRVNEFKTVLDAARILRDRLDILFLFIGEGAKASEIENFARAEALENIRMLPYQPRETLRYSLAAGDASLVTLAEGLAGLSVPSKTYGILAAGRPILFVGDAQSSTARLVSENNCGAIVSSGDGARLAQIVSDWASDKERLAQLNAASRTAFEKHYSRERAVNSYLETFAKCMENSHSPGQHKVSNIEETSL
jgi:glycosyltransferase involved in cell wall biosynthesis